MASPSTLSVRIVGTAPPAKPVKAKPTPIVGNPVQLTPIPWRRPDRALAQVVLRHIAEVTPPTVIPHNPLMEQRMHSLLRSLRIDHY